MRAWGSQESNRGQGLGGRRERGLTERTFGEAAEQPEKGMGEAEKFRRQYQNQGNAMQHTKIYAFSYFSNFAGYSHCFF